MFPLTRGSGLVSVKPMMEHDQPKLLAEIETFLAQRGMKAGTFGMRAVNDGKFVGRLRRGADLHTRTAARVRAFIVACKAAEAQEAARLAQLIANDHRSVAAA